MQVYYVMVIHKPTVTSPLWVYMHPRKFVVRDADDLRDQMRKAIGPVDGLDYDVLVYEGFDVMLKPGGDK